MENVSDLKTDNVLFMRAQNPIFSQELKDKMVRTLGTEDAEQVVTNMEHVICSHFVLKLRELGTKIGSLIGERISEKLGIK
jgi:hypothetical protein